MNTTDFSVLKTLGLEVDAEFKDLWRLDNGTIITIESVRYVIKDISTRFYKDTDEMYQDKGCYSGAGEPLPFNFAITYYINNK